MTQTSKKTQSVWHFIDYHSRFGMESSPDRKIKVQQYVKLYINGWDGPGGEVLTALNMMERHTDAVWLEGAMWRLLKIATNTSPEYQGYLLNSRKCPASSKEIGSMLRVDGRRALAALTKLETAGILEQVPLPVRFFGDKTDNGLPQSLPSGTNPSKKKGGKRAKKPAARARNGDPPLKGESNRNAAAQQKKNRDDETQLEQELRGLPPALQPRREGESQEQYVARRRQGLLDQLGNATTTTSPTTTPAMMTAIDSATNRDDGGPCHGGSRTAPHVDSGGTERVGQVIKLNRLNRSRYHAEAWRVAQDVIEAIGYKAPNRPAYANEEARWAKAWDHLMAAHSSDMLHEVERKLMDKARVIGGCRGRYTNPEAYLRKSLDNLVIDVKRKRREMA